MPGAEAPAARGAKVAVAPAGVRTWLVDAVRAGGGEVVDPGDAEALVWSDAASPAALAELLDANPRIAWVQLPWAGIEPYVDVVRAHADRTWTCGKGVYARPVAELALMLSLAGLRGGVAYARTRSWRGPGEIGTTLAGAEVVVLGGGGIAEALLELLQPLRARTTVVRRRPEALAGADRTLGPEALHDLLPGADLVVLTLALTPETTGVIGAAELALLPSHAWVVNVARGAHIDTDALVDALAAGTIGGAGLDVTDPEPLPDDHPLWSQPNCLVTPHVGNTRRMAVPLLSARVRDNVERFASGRPLVGLVDPSAGY